MQPSSLIFVAIVAIWAAFLIQHWVRRREALATARSVDRFSEAIRLLERRPVLQSPEPRPAPEVYAALPSPLVARSTGGRTAGPSRGPVPATRPVMPARTAGLGSLRSRAPHWGRLGRRVRAIAFLGLAALVPITLALSAVGVLRWTSVVVALAGLALGVLMLRYAAVHERTLARVERSLSGSEGSSAAPALRRRPAPTARRAAPASAASRTTAATATSALGSAGPEGLDAGAAPVAAGASTGTAGEAPASPEPAAAPVVAAAVAPGERASRRAAYAAYSADGTWQPVAVPPPTYTLKARAEHPQPQPAEVTPTPEPTPREPAVVEAPARAVGD